jgi:hypothetical protein
LDLGFKGVSGLSAYYHCSAEAMSFFTFLWGILAAVSSTQPPGEKRQPKP